MLLELRAGQLKREEENKVNVLQDIEKLLTSKDFDVRLDGLFFMWVCD